MASNFQYPWGSTQTTPMGGVANVGSSAILSAQGNMPGEWYMAGSPLIAGKDMGSAHFLSPNAMQQYNFNDYMMRQQPEKDRLQLQMLKQQMAQRSAIVNALLGMANNSGNAISNVNANQVQELFNSALKSRADTFTPGVLGRANTNYRGGDVNNLIQQYKSALGNGNNGMWAAAREQAMQGANQNYQSALRDLRGLQGRGQPAMTGQARLADLITSRMMAQKDIERSLMGQRLQMQQGLMSDLGGLLNSDRSNYLQANAANSANALQELTNRLGNPEAAAQLNLQAQIANAQASAAVAQQRQATMGSLLGLLGGQ